MRRIHGSMMDAAGGRAGDQAPARHLASPALGWAPLLHAFAVQGALGRAAQQQSSQALTAGAAWPLMAWNPTAWQEGLALAGAIAGQLQSLQALWLEGLDEWAREAGELKHANTVSKLVDQEMNLVQQGLALLANQATASTRLGENIQANLGYWLARKVEAA